MAGRSNLLARLRDFFGEELLAMTPHRDFGKAVSEGLLLGSPFAYGKGIMAVLALEHPGTLKSQ